MEIYPATDTSKYPPRHPTPSSIVFSAGFRLYLLMFPGTLHTLIRLFLCFCLVAVYHPFPASSQSQSVVIKHDPQTLSADFYPEQLKAITVSLQDPLHFDFYIDSRNENSSASDEQRRYLVLIKDFFTALTIPETDIWVNLSPLEQNRIIEERFGLTDTGRDLLAQDLLLKQIASALLYPEDASGRHFWDEVYRRIWEEYGTTDIPVDIFNRVWIVPEQAEVYQEGSSAIILEGHMKVMLEKDYLASDLSAGIRSHMPRAPDENSQTIPAEALREIIIPLLEKEVNEGKTFFRLRQIYQALILSTWYKKTMRESFLGKTYADRSKTGGIRQTDPEDNQRIYNRYVETYRKGAFNFIREEIDRNSGEPIQRKYFSGGFSAENFSQKVIIRKESDFDASQPPKPGPTKRIKKVSTSLRPSSADNPYPFDEEVQRLSNTLRNLHQQIKNEDLVASAQVLGPDQTTLNAVLTQIKQNASNAIDIVLSNEEQKNLVMSELAEKIVNGEKTTLQSLLFDGTHTTEVLRHLLAVTMLARQDAPVPTEEILKLMGLRAGSVAATAGVIENSQDIYELEDLENGLFGLLKTRPSGLKEPGIDHTATLHRLRAEEGVFRSHFDRPTQRPPYFKKIIQDAQRLLPRAQKIVDVLTHFARAVDLRVKTGSSASRKSNLKPLMEISDFIGGRAIYKDLSDMETQIQRLLNRTSNDKVDILDEWIDRVKEEQDALEKRLSRFKKTSAQYQALQQELADHNNRRRNLMNSKPLMIEFDNKFMSNRDSYYRAMQFLFAVGTGTWTFELQMKTLPAAITQDMEHTFYKNKKKNSPLLSAIRRHNRLVNIIELINYLYSRQDINPNWILFEINKHLPPQGEKTSSVDPAAVSVASPTGGIDARHIENKVFLSGSNDMPALIQEFQNTDYPDGFEAEILSIHPADDLSSVFPAQYPLAK